MNDIVLNYAYHLDNLRIASKMTVDKLCEGICDTRMYRRYKTGEKTLTHLKIIEFCEKLDISPSDFYYSASEKDRYELLKIKKLYLILGSKNLTEFANTLKTINEERIINRQNEKFLQYCILRADYMTKKIGPSEAYQSFSNIINYPDCIKKRIFDFLEIACLSAIAEIEVEQPKMIALDKLITILKDPELIYVSSESRHVLPQIFANTSLYLARLSRFEDSRALSSEGIDYSIMHSDFGSLTLLRYSKTYSLLQLGLVKDAELEAIKCLSNAISRENRYELKMYHNALIKDFKYDPLDLIPTYKQIIFGE
jgi:hypothetical protein